MRRFAMAFWGPPRDGTIYGSMQIDVSKAQRFQADYQAKHDSKPSIGQLVGRAVAEALKETPDANSKIIWGRPYVSDSVDVYFQVDVGDGKDLSGVTVHDCANKSIQAVSTELRAAAGKLHRGEDEQYEKTQKGALGYLPVFLIRWLLALFSFLEFNLGNFWLHKLLGARPEPFGTVQVTNVSKFGIDCAYAPLISVGRVPFIVLVGRIVDQPWVVDGELAVRPVITLNATFDHRVIDGNKIGRIVRRIRAYMENPYAYEPDVGLADPGAEVAAA
jgi:pyruvate dehydrogenase E2 component (dihydrolipoamide acetyltransferase)